MQMAYGDKNLFYTFFLFIVEKFDFQVIWPFRGTVGKCMCQCHKCAGTRNAAI